MAADAAAALADQTDAGAGEADAVTEAPATTAPDTDGTAGDAPTSETPATGDDTAASGSDDTAASGAGSADPEATTDAAPAAAAADGSDKLTAISGIGPKYSGILTDAGVTTYAALAGMSVEDIQKAIADAGSTTAGNEETWPEQARMLADGDTEGHAAYVESQKS